MLPVVAEMKAKMANTIMIILSRIGQLYLYPVIFSIILKCSLFSGIRNDIGFQIVKFKEVGKDVFNEFS